MVRCIKLLIVISMKIFTMKPIKAVENDIIEEFQALPDVDAKYAHLFRLGDALPAMDPALKTNQNQVKGCQSTLWFHLSEDQGCLTLVADSDSMVIKGITALLARLIAGRSAEDIQAIGMDFIDEIKIWKLASERNNGLLAMLDHLKQQAKMMESDYKTTRAGT